MLWPKTGPTQYVTHLGLQNKGSAINGFVVFNDWDLKPLDLLNGLVLGCYFSVLVKVIYESEAFLYIEEVCWSVCRSLIDILDLKAC